MTTNVVELPYKYYPDFKQGRPVFKGEIYIGKVGTDPELPENQKQVYISEGSIFDDTAVEASQPIATSAGGVPEFNGSPVAIFVDGDYSIKVLDRFGDQVYYSANAQSSEPITAEDGLTRLDSINDFFQFEGIQDQQVSLASWYADGYEGGSIYTYDEDRDRADHNGGTIIAPDVEYTGDNDAYRAASGTGQGCWISINTFITSNMFGIPEGQNQNNLSRFQSNFDSRKNPVAIYPGLVAINNPTDGSVFDFASFGGQGIPGFNPIGFIYHHYTDSTMIQIDNVGEDNAVLFLKNANNPVRRADQPDDFIGSGRFIECWRNESDGAGGVTPSKWGFYMSKDFELVWPQQTTGTETVRLVNNVAAATPIWNYEFKNSNEQQFLFRIDNDGNVPISFEWNAAASATLINTSDDLSLRPLGELILNPQGDTVKAQKPFRPPVYARSNLPSLGGVDTGAMAYLQDGSDEFPIHWDGINWLKVSDNTLV